VFCLDNVQKSENAEDAAAADTGGCLVCFLRKRRSVLSLRCNDENVLIYRQEIVERRICVLHWRSWYLMTPRHILKRVIHKQEAQLPLRNRASAVTKCLITL